MLPKYFPVLLTACALASCGTPGHELDHLISTTPITGYHPTGPFEAGGFRDRELPGNAVEVTVVSTALTTRERVDQISAARVAELCTLKKFTTFTIKTTSQKASCQGYTFQGRPTGTPHVTKIETQVIGQFSNDASGRNCASEFSKLKAGLTQVPSSDQYQQIIASWNGSCAQPKR